MSDIERAVALLAEAGYSVKPPKPTREPAHSRASGEPARSKRKKNTTPDTFASEEIAAILAEAADNASGARFRAIVALMAASGLRIGEAVLLRPDSIRQGDGVLLVDVPKDGKTGERTVPIEPASIEPHMSDWLAVRPDSPWLFAAVWDNGGAGHVHPNAVNRELKRAAKAAGITRNVHAHMFRHTAATGWARAGWEPSAIQQMLGHRDGTMTMWYVQADTKRLEELVKRK